MGNYIIDHNSIEIDHYKLGHFTRHWQLNIAIGNLILQVSYHFHCINITIIVTILTSSFHRGNKIFQQISRADIHRQVNIMKSDEDLESQKYKFTTDDIIHVSIVEFHEEVNGATPGAVKVGTKTHPKKLQNLAKTGPKQGIKKTHSI